MMEGVWTLWVVFIVIFFVLVGFGATWLMSHRHS